MVRFIAATLLFATTPAFADEVDGKVLAFDRVANVIVMEDKSVFTVPNPDVIPTNLSAGESIKITYISDGDNGLSKVTGIIRN